MMRLLLLVAEHPRRVLIAALLLSVLAVLGLVDPGTGQPRLRLDPSPEGLLPPGGDVRLAYDRVQFLSGGGDPIVVAVGADAVFEHGFLERLARMTKRLEQVEGVNRVFSLSNAASVRSRDGDVQVGPLLEEIPREPAALSALQAEALDNSLLAGVLVARDARTAVLLVHLEPMTDAEMIESRLDRRVAAAARDEAGPHPVWISGFPRLKAATSDTLRRDLARTLPLVIVLMAVTLAVGFRSVRGVLVPMATIVVALLWTCGAIAALGGSLNVVTVIVPPLVVTLAFAYNMHVVYDYDHMMRASPDVAPRAAVRHTLEEVGLPVIVTGVTTAAGFLALVVSPIPAVREFGLFSLLGVTLTVLAALTFTPALLGVLPTPSRVRAPRQGSWVERLAERLADFDLSRRGLVIGGALVLLLVAMVGASRIVVANRFISNFPEDSEVRVDFDAIDERLSGANAMQVLVETEVRNGLLEPENLTALLDFQTWLMDQPEVGQASSFVDYLMLLNRAFDDGGREGPAVPESRRPAVPESRRLAGQLLFLGGGEQSGRLIDNSRTVGVISVLAQSGDSGSVARLVSRMEERLAELPGSLKATVTGNMVLVARSVNAVARGQWNSLILAFGIIYLVLSLLFTSFWVGLIALLPNALPIAVYFGAMGYTGITLNVSTALVGCVALGIAVDDTIHYFARFNADARRLGDERKATRATLRGILHPITFTTLGLCMGFMVLTTSTLRTQVEFGALAAFSLAVAWLIDVTLSPALCAGLRVVTLWDLLTLDLGASPQKSIPLFRGLSERQARIFTLMSDVREIPEGERLFAEGETGHDMYVILDGTLTASVERDGKRVELASVHRGDTVGEIGLFTGGRTADVRASSPARLIRFDPEDLERLRRRYPRTAVKVYRNLNQIQAARMTRTIQAVR
jgi:predicted RND superfamily exporter protein